MIVKKINTISFAMAFAEINSIIAIFISILIGLTTFDIAQFLLSAFLLLLIGIINGFVTGIILAELYNLISKYHPQMRFDVEV